MRFIRSASAATMLGGVALLSGTAAPAFAAGPQIDVYPSVAAPGQTVSFSVVCRSGSSATLSGTTLGLPGRIPMSPATHTGVFQVSVTIPRGTRPGDYAPSVDCANGLSGTGTLTVSAGVAPVGPPLTGDGMTATATGGAVTAAGAVLLGLGGLTGALAIQRRRRA